ncbi:hypothetical protein ElyMa_000026600 [Elysia marginata]|uniref:Uncharacterized protein n=1 Tax=Elysia marginata TaxID=1093978 RepID=A0AAV4ECM8_9GAST|nr:hypothetical protein ElyMa_000026600 [Elysia marginata]
MVQYVGHRLGPVQSVTLNPGETKTKTTHRQYNCRGVSCLIETFSTRTVSHYASREPLPSTSAWSRQKQTTGRLESQGPVEPKSRET